MMLTLRTMRFPEYAARGPFVQGLRYVVSVCREEMTHRVGSGTDRRTRLSCFPSSSERTSMKLPALP